MEWQFKMKNGQVSPGAFQSQSLVACLLSMILLGCSLMLGCKKQKPAEAAAASTPAPKAGDAATRALREIGDKAVIAMMSKDATALLEFDHEPDDAASLQNKSGDLYCYLFDSSCATWGKGRSVYEIFSTSRQLAIDASVATVPVKGKLYGLLMFYDKTRISDQQVYSQDFLCSEKGQRETVSWHFVLSDGKWSTSSLFDYKTERPCNK